MNTPNIYERNVKKEQLQDVILQYVYNTSGYNTLLFTGGTCLKKVYGLNRLSEDLDFDIPKNITFDIRVFADDLKKYLLSLRVFGPITTKISKNNQTVFIKFPDNVFVRCDFSLIQTTVFETQQSFITANNRQFLVLSYDLPTLWANKIVAFLTRSFYKGKFQTIPFKGRDIYDLYWLLQLSAKTGYTLKPNMKRLKALMKPMTPKNITREIQKKIALVDPKFVVDDLSPLVESRDLVDRFVTDFENVISKQISYVLPPTIKPS